jgi:hypothetical protein
MNACGPCLKCGKELDRVTSCNGMRRRPRPGDVSICLYCSDIAILSRSGLRPPTEDEIDELAENEEVVRTLVTIELWRAWRQEQNKIH